ncbi:MAG: histidine kinase [Pseudomonadota bacterium]
MNNFVKITTIASLALALGAGAALADNDRRGGLRAMDTDNSRSISLAEFEAAMASRFAEFDSNGDGTISSEELLAIVSASDDRRLERRAARIRGLDANWDGQLTSAELQAASASAFERRDINNDGQLDRSDRRGSGRDGGKSGRGGDRR